jgi:hypothetical protein
MQVLVLRGYRSKDKSKEIIQIKDISITIELIPLGNPILIRKSMKKILSNHNLNNYDKIYLASMSACATSLIDKKHFHKIILVAPFFLRFKTIYQLVGIHTKDFLSCILLITLNGRMGVLSEDMRVKLAELDDVVNNNYFIKKSNNVEIMDRLDHYLGNFSMLDIVTNDLKKNI